MPPVCQGWPTAETGNPGRQQISARGYNEFDKGFRLGRTELEVLSEHLFGNVLPVTGGVSVQLLTQ